MRSSSLRAVVRGFVAVMFIVFSIVLLFGLTVHPQKARAASSPVRIMPLGDSITGGPGCWRALLWNQLQSAGYTNIHFVGTQQGGGCQTAYYDINEEGHGGFSATMIANQNLLPAWLSATSPDIVLMHLGTNDSFSNTPPATILAAYTTMIKQMRANNPNMIVLVAQIIPINPTNGCDNCTQDVVDLDAAIPAWAASLTTTQSPVIVVDQFTGFQDATDTVDGVHPSASGNQKIAARWFPPLTAELNTFMTPVPPTTPTVTTPVSTPTSTPGGGCHVTYTVSSQWSSGFGANIAITNTGTTAWNGWTLTFSFANGQTITQLWNGSVSQTGGNVTITNAAYNGSVAAGASVSPGPGFNGFWNGTNNVPSSFVVNGATCS